ncbi:UvrD-helicase domain-containing protein [Kaistia dalseonensis]|uniref:DNA 3'-5' helicase n=1 Tax=Kaistia dalseonensis TaxID=410840 RepID=A0ABU0HBQ5_9HYPH|nr:UvrD-helicase domain-containing protein [Kaistia dalseonensis]MCX5497116.1 UvrD-helicase domain-containing protein [Kaistia dalseonensis]MDQ0439742.1 DNA helicase-2/ATP-dependent DNA helicase PcrA [Kaistia dalseonensis]
MTASSDITAPGPRPGGIAARALGAKPIPDYVARLNPEQRLAVETTDGPVLVLAGAGTGKTRVLTTRIAHLLATGKAHPSQILAVTFTNKAAREMRHRIGDLIGPSVEGMNWLGTFHSIGVKILRRHAELVGLKSSFTILDTDDQIRLMKQVIQAEGIDEKRWPAKQLAALIDGWKNRGLVPKDVPPGDGGSFANGKAVKLYIAYQERLKVLNACDFGDLLLENLRLFREHPDVLKEYHQRFHYMLVDEYQDTNVAQYLWLRLLAQGRRNICCVGDDDQSIYGWRGAEVDNILRFEKDFPGAVVIRLERNYRSTSHILGAASHLIAHNQGRLGKTLFTEANDPDSVKVQVSSSWDSEEEARAIGEKIEDLQRQGHRLNDMAILVRASFQMRSFEDRFITLGLNYRVIGGPRFYERQEIRDALAYFRVVAQPADDLAFERIVNTPRRGIGDTSIKLLYDYGRSRGIPITQAAEELVQTEEVKAKTRTALRDLMASFERWRGKLGTIKHTELAEIILDESGYTEMWQQDRSADAPGRLENLKELIRSMDEFESMEGFLEHIALVMDKDNAENQDAVSIMTLHSAKGLEFETVFLPGWEEGLFPHQRALDESGRAGLEEERRLAYVGITRAKKRASIWFASNRRIHGLWQSNVPSRFLDELPEKHVDVVEQTSNYGGYNVGGVGNYGASRFDRADPFQNTYSTPGWQRAQANRAAGAKPAAKSNTRLIEGELIAKSTGSKSDYAIGERVFHQKFGYGHIEDIEGNKLTVAFEKAGTKKVVDSFVSKN